MSKFYLVARSGSGEGSDYLGIWVKGFVLPIDQKVIKVRDGVLIKFLNGEY